MPIRPSTHRARGQARRTQLLQAAIEVIAEKGVGGVTHRAVAARAGMPLSTTSYFFASLDDLIVAALHYDADDVTERVTQRIKAITDNGLDRNAAIDEFVELVMDSPASAVTTRFEVYLECTRRPSLQGIAHQIMAHLERNAEAALRALGVAEAGDQARILIALADGFTLHQRAWPRGESDRRVLRAALDALIRGFETD